MRERKKLICKNCKKEFYPLGGYLKQQYCSKKCFYTDKKVSPKKGKKYPHLQRARIGKCLVCGVEFRAVGDYTGRDGVKREQKYCSKKCWSIRGVKLLNYICKNCGKIFYTKDKRCHGYCSRKCSHEHMVGERSGQWKDGLSLERERARYSNKLTVWRKKVYKRDNYTCQECGVKGKIHAHHIKSWAEYPILRFNISNGITLCEKCHGHIHGKNFSNRRNKKCKECGAKIKGTGKTGMCRSCSIKVSWTVREDFTGKKAVKL